MRNRFAVTTVILLVVCVVLGALLIDARQKLHDDPQQRYPLLAKRIFLDHPNDTIVNFTGLRKEIKSYLANTKIPHSFYFEYLPTGSNIRDGDRNELVGASLMKIPVVMDMYKASAEGKLSLDQKITVPAEAVSGDVVFGAPGQLKAGDRVTLREAAKLALTRSDNTAAYLIYQHSKDLLPDESKSIHSLDVELSEKPTETGTYVLISSRAYASFLSCLYFSCYLDRDHSQEILGYLTDSTDNDRLRAGVPQDIPVARKIGSFSKQTQSDCGIVYVPNRPYLICLMLQSDDAMTNKHFQNISRMAYEYVRDVN